MITIVITARDRFSTIFSCLETLEKNTPESYQLIIVLGGAPKSIEEKLKARYGNKAQLIFEKKFLNPPESRNIGIRAAKTPLAVFVDDDVYVRPGWLTPLIDCQKETGAVMVVPVILETPTLIHTAGNDFFITYKNGKAYGSKVLRYNKRVYLEDSNMKRARTDYGELHCHMVDVAVALKIGVFDEKVLETSESDCGLTWKKNGYHELWFEPKSVVYFAQCQEVVDPVDIRFFDWKWNMSKSLRGYIYFRNKWNIDITEYHGFKEFLVFMNNKLGLLPRLLPCRFTLWLDQRFRRLRLLAIRVLNLWGYTKARLYGYGDWLKDTY